MRALLIVIAALLVAPQVQAAKPEGKGKTQPLQLLAIDGDGFLLGHVLGIDIRRSGTAVPPEVLTFYSAEIAAVVNLDLDIYKTSAVAVVVNTDSAAVFFDGPNCSGDVFVVFNWPPAMWSLVVIGQPGEAARRYFAPSLSAAQRSPVQSELILDVGCVPRTGSVTGFPFEEVTDVLPFLDLIPLPISVVPTN